MNDYSLPRVGNADFRTARTPRHRINGLALGITTLAAGAWTLLLGNPAAVASSPPDLPTGRAQLTRRLPKALGLELAPQCFRTDKPEPACFLEGDFDGDDKPDQAVLVQAKGCLIRASAVCSPMGIAFLLGNGKTAVLGAGHGRWRPATGPNERLGPDSAVTKSAFAVTSIDTWFWRVWHLTAEGPRPTTGHGPFPTKAPPGMRRDAVELSGGDAAILLYRSAHGWIKYDLGY